MNEYKCIIHELPLGFKPMDDDDPKVPINNKQTRLILTIFIIILLSFI